MVELAGDSLGKLPIAPVLTLTGLVVREVVVRAGETWQARRSPLGRFFWQIRYDLDDTDWTKPLSIDLVSLHRRGRRVRGKMFRVYERNERQDWAFNGELIADRQLCLTYRPIDADYGSNGMIILDPLKPGIWCGDFHEASSLKRNAVLLHAAARVGVVKQIGGWASGKSHVEWLAADHDGNDAVRRFLAAIPVNSPTSPTRIARQLPRRMRHVLLTPPLPTRRLRARRTLSRIVPIRALRRRVYRARWPAPGKWSSPAREFVLRDPDEDQAA